MTRFRTRGFTLLEVMIVVIIVGILAAIALPAYQHQVKKGNRSAAQQFLLDIVVKEQQILMDGRTYIAVAANADFPNKPSGSPPGVGLTPPDTLAGKYTFDVFNVSMTATPPTFTARATAASGQEVDANSVQVTVDHAGLRQYRNSGGSATGTW